MGGIRFASPSAARPQCLQRTGDSLSAPPARTARSERDLLLLHLRSTRSRFSGARSRIWNLFTPTTIRVSCLHLALIPVGRTLDLGLDKTRLDRRDHPAQVIDLRDRAAAPPRSIASVMAST